MYAGYVIFRDQTPAKWLLGGVIVMYVVHGYSAYFSQKFVFYGRTVHMYLPFLVMAAVVSISMMHSLYVRRAIMVFLAGCALISFAVFIKDYHGITYPGDLFFKHVRNVPFKNLFVLRPADNRIGDYKGYDAVFVNFVAYEYEFRDQEIHGNAIPGMLLVEDVPHPLKFKAYTFENYPPEVRRRFMAWQYRMRVFKRQEISAVEGPAEFQSYYPGFVWQVKKTKTIVPARLSWVTY